MSPDPTLRYRHYLRYLLQIPSLYIPGRKPHIFLFSTRRSGSTLLRDMIYSQPGFNYIDQPFDLTRNQFNPYRQNLPDFSSGQLVQMSDDELKQVENYLNRLLARRYIVRSQWRVWSKSYHWIWNRYVVKELNAKPLMPWFERIWSKRAMIVYMTRHPLASASSTLHKKWQHTAGVFLRSPEFCRQYLDAEMASLSQQIIEDGSALEKFVLDWCLENLVPSRLWQSSSWLTVSYEALVRDPLAACQRICSRLDLPDIDRMVQVASLPSPSATKNSRRDIEERGAQSRLDAWRREIDLADLAKISRILDTFQISLYNVQSQYAQAEFDQ